MMSVNVPVATSPNVICSILLPSRVCICIDAAVYIYICIDVAVLNRLYVPTCHFLKKFTAFVLIISLPLETVYVMLF